MVSSEEYLANMRKLVDARLDELLPQETSQPTRLHTAMRYSVFAGGKRIRPVLCIASCEALGGSVEQALSVASAIEILHTYTLIHDDLPAMDDDDMRRGKPSCHKAFDEYTAILAGDALLTASFEWLASTGNAFLVQELARATGSLGTVGGQQDDMQAKGSVPSQEELLSLHQRKTANLFSASCAMGGVVAGASGDQVRVLRAMGESLGMAFQLLDDVCDNDPVTMKVLGQDETLRLAKKYEDISYSKLFALKGDVSQLRGILEYTYKSFIV